MSDKGINIQGFWENETRLPGLLFVLDEAASFKYNEIKEDYISPLWEAG